ncbi:MAG TPA: flagellar hook-basal body complex protein, partial [Candidatus Saccharimonadales bacterium]|nr:flagellar hook-basal body complex protein [Candidatus Saccharimonadales bacterium]
MLLSLDSGVSALDQFQQDLNVIGNNIANVDTVGFKSANMQFADALSQTIGDNAAGVEQIGTGVVTSSIADTFTQGSITSSGVPTNMAIDGNGFFLVKDPTSGEEYVTRDGNFTVDPNGYLVNSVGMRVQGYTNSTGTTIGDIQITNANAPGGDTSPVQSYTFSSNGDVNIQLADGTQYVGGQVLLQNFTAPT